MEAQTDQRVYVIGARTLERVREHEWHTVASEHADAARPTITMLSPFDQCSAHTFAIKEITASYRRENVTIGLDWIKFQGLAAQWRAGRNPLSSSAWDNVRHPSYQRIIGMGITAVPFILHELQSELRKGEPDDWFVALWAITGENPVHEGSRGKITEMAKAWLQWGIREGHVSGENLGARISAFRRMDVQEPRNEKI
jgi:hypothetical protein